MGDSPSTAAAACGRSARRSQYTIDLSSRTTPQDHLATPPRGLYRPSRLQTARRRLRQASCAAIDGQTPAFCFPKTQKRVSRWHRILSSRLARVGRCALRLSSFASSCYAFDPFERLIQASRSARSTKTRRSCTTDGNAPAAIKARTAGALRPMYSAACFRVRSRLPLEKPAWSAIREATALAIASISSDSSFIAALLRQKPHLVHSLRLAAA